MISLPSPNQAQPASRNLLPLSSSSHRIKGTAQSPSTATEHRILVNVWSSQDDADPSLGAFSTRATASSKARTHQHTSRLLQTETSHSGHYVCCPLGASLSAFLPGNTTGITSKDLQQFLPELLAIIKAG